jgi:uncharacterized membrane protein YdbT with pleckstrin-like domain
MGILKMIVTASRVAKVAENTKHEDAGKIVNDIASVIVIILIFTVLVIVLAIGGIAYLMHWCATR